jgi:ubiquinone/menaquinone biosynthesis C-methylase UbiE
METGPSRVFCRGCGRQYPVVFGEVPDFAPLEGFRDATNHSYTYSYSSRFYELGRKSFLMELSTGIPYKKEESLLIEKLELGDGMSALDIGCGTGIFSRRFAALCPASEIFGLDYSYSQLRQAVVYRKKERISNLHFIHGQAAVLPFAGAMFDRVITVGAMQFFGPIESFFKETFRVLKPGGLFVALNYLDLQYKKSKLPLALMSQKAAEKHGDHLFSKDKITAAAGGASFRDIDYFEKDITFILKARKT